MENLYKQMTATQGKVKMEVTLNGGNSISVKTTACMRPKNHRQKKLWKQEAYKMKRVEKGLYEITMCCHFNLEMFAKVIKQIRKDKNGDLWFIDPNEQSESTSQY